LSGLGLVLNPILWSLAYCSVMLTISWSPDLEGVINRRSSAYPKAPANRFATLHPDLDYLKISNRSFM
jgi:hypothetical protein